MEILSFHLFTKKCTFYMMYDVVKANVASLNLTAVLIRERKTYLRTCPLRPSVDEFQLQAVLDVHCDFLDYLRMNAKEMGNVVSEWV